MERAVEGAGSSLQEEVGTFLRPLHLLLLGEAPAKETPQNKRIEYGQLRVDSFWEAVVVSVA